MSSAPIVTLVRDYAFEAAHFLPRVPESHKCRRMHGHSYKVRVTLVGPIDPELGWLVDFSALDEIVDPIVREIDHRVLNEIAGLDNPTSELLAVWLWRRVSAAMPHLVEIEVAETADSRCAFRGPTSAVGHPGASTAPGGA
jgi:6-pyruvoyltetrahydropterin/6-carboxytetrahydropterin synthase